MFDEYVEHSGKPGAPTSIDTRALPQVHYEGFEPNTAAASGLGSPTTTRVDAEIDKRLLDVSHEDPVFRLAPVQYTPPATITNLAVSNNILIMAFNNNNFHRIDMAMQDYIGELSLGKKPLEATVHKIFLDPSGKHLLITTTQGDNYYLFEGWKKAKQLSRLKMIVECVAWNDEKLSPLSPIASQSGAGTHEILLGGRNGTIYEALVSPAEEFFKSPDRYVQAVYTVPDKQPVSGIKFERLRDDPTRAVVVIATASRLYQLSGIIGNRGDTDGSRVFEGLFASYKDTPAKYMELSGNLQQSSLQFYSPEYVDGPLGKRMAWLTSRGLFHATLSTARSISGDLSSQDLLDASSLLPYPSAPSDGGTGRSPGVKDPTSADSFPLGVALTEFHFILLLKDRVMGYSRLDESLVYDEIIPLRRGERLLGTVSDPIKRTFWVYSTNGLYEIDRVNEERDVWRIYLEKADYTLALQFAKLQIHRDAVLSAQGASFFSQGQFVQAAQSYAQSTTAPFEEVTLKFVDAGERDALRCYLRSRLGSTRKTDITQRTMLATWLVEFYLNKCNELDDLIASSSASADVSNLQTEQAHLEEELQQFFETYKSNLDRRTTYDLIRAHGRMDVFLNFANVSGDFERVIEYWVSEEEWVKAIDVLNRQFDVELYYRFASVLMSAAPKETVDAWIRRPALDPIRLIPALLQQQHRPLNPMQQNHSVRYLNHLIFEQENHTPTLHNLIITFLASSSNTDDGPLLRFLMSAPADETGRPYYDLDYALRVCRANGRVQPCVHVYAKMGLYEESVSLALEKGDLELARVTANMPEDDVQLRKKLWLKVARYVVEDKKDLKTAMQFLSNTELLKIEDILPFFPDFVVIDDFKDEICNALEDYSAHIVELKQEMDSAMESAAAVSKDIAQLKNRFVTIEQGERCTQCRAPLLSRQFYVFPCQHTFHADCLIGLVKESSSAVQLRRIVTLQTELVKLRDAAQSNGQPTISAPVPQVPQPNAPNPRMSQTQRTLLSSAFATSGANGSLARAMNPLTAAAVMGSAVVTASDRLRDLIVPDALATAVGVWGGRGRALGGVVGLGGDHTAEGEIASRIEVLRAELDTVLAGSCPLCDSVVSGLDKPFVKDGEVDASWTI